MRLISASATSARPPRRFATQTSYDANDAGNALGRESEMAGYLISGNAMARPARPSTIVRIERLRALISELATRDMDLIAMSGFLKCSQSGTRNYIAELVVAKVLNAPDFEPNESGHRNKQYRLSSDLQKIRRFLAGLAAPRKASDGLTRFDRRPHPSLADARYLHVLTAGAASIREAEELGARRDPLVEALFGEASSASEFKPRKCSQPALDCADENMSSYVSEMLRRNTDGE